MEFKKRKLANGLTVIAECNADAHTAAVGFFVKTGARDEESPHMGVSHFLEHMMFKGTARRSAEDVNREFDEMGASYNAFTTHEQTVYFAHVLPEFLPRAVDLLGDILRPALREDDFEMEKKVILEEIGMYDDRPVWRLQDQLLESYFNDHPLSFRVLGTRRTVGDLTADQMRGYFQRRYSPDNIVVSAVGRLDFDRLIDDLNSVAGAWEPTGAVRRYEQPAPSDFEQTIHDDKVTRHYLAIAWPGPSVQDDRRYAAKILADVLGDAEGSRIYWALVDPGLADEADLSIVGQDRLGYYFAYASCDPERAETVERILIDTIEGVVRDLNPDELERAKNKLATSATLQGERPSGRMNALGCQWLYLNEYLPLEVDLERLMAVTVDDLRQLIQDLPFGLKTIVRLTPARN